MTNKECFGHFKPTRGMCVECDERHACVRARARFEQQMAGRPAPYGARRVAPWGPFRR
jgi:hypothetical protein